MIAVQKMYRQHQARLCDECARERLELELQGDQSPEATAKWLNAPRKDEAEHELARAAHDAEHAGDFDNEQDRR